MRILIMNHPSTAAVADVRTLVRKYGADSIVASIQALARAKAHGAQAKGCRAEAIDLQVLSLKLQEVSLECPSGLAALAAKSPASSE